MPSIQLAQSSGRYLSFAEREEIALLKAQVKGVREIARRLEQKGYFLRRFPPVARPEQIPSSRPFWFTADRSPCHGHASHAEVDIVVLEW